MWNSAYPGSDHEQYGTEDGAQQVPQTFAVQLHWHGYQQSSEHKQSLHTHKALKKDNIKQTLELKNIILILSKVW